MVKEKSKNKCRTNPKNPFTPCPDGYIKKNKYDEDCCYIDFKSRKQRRKIKEKPKPKHPILIRTLTQQVPQRLPPLSPET